MLKVTKSFFGHGYDSPVIGTLIDPPEPSRAYLVSIGVAEVYEAKIVKPAKEVKKRGKKSSASQQAAPRLRKKTAKRSKKTATK